MVQQADPEVDLGFFAESFSNGRDALFLIAVPGCPPCLRMKEVVRESRVLHPKIPNVSIFVLDAAQKVRLAEIVGKAIRIFPSLCYCDRNGDSHWLHGAADKCGPFDAERIADWVLKKRDHLNPQA